MKIYDISQEVFGCTVFPGDPAPERQVLSEIEKGGSCNLTAIRMCAHNGTHVDAPYHFCADGKTIDEVGLEVWIGPCYVAEHEGVVTAEDMRRILKRAEEAGRADCALPRTEKAGVKNTAERIPAWAEPADAAGVSKRILIKGRAELSAEAARVCAEAGLLLYGNESQTVGPESAPAEVHRILLGSGCVLLEGIRLGSVPEGAYLLNAAPLNLGGADGAPCRAVLMELE